MAHRPISPRKWNRRGALRVGAGMLGLGLADVLRLKSSASPVTGPNAGFGQAKSCIVLFCWGGMSHLDSFDMKPDAADEVRGEFQPVETATPGIFVSEHLPRVAQVTDHIAVVRSMHHRCTAHGKGMYWNLTGHAPPAVEAAVNLPPSRDDWPSLPAMIAQFRDAPAGMPRAVRLPYPMVDNGTLQAGDWGGWLGVAGDPLVMRTPRGEEFGGVSRDLGAPVLNLSEGIDVARIESRRALLDRLEIPAEGSRAGANYVHFQNQALDMLVRPEVCAAFDLDQESDATHEAYGDHLCGQSALLARRLTEAGVPIVQVICAAGDLNGSKGDHWDTHGDNFNRLKNTMLPVFDRAYSALLTDLHARGRLEETLVVVMGDFGRTPKINGGAGRDHYPFAYGVQFAGGGIRGGQVYGSSDAIGAFPHDDPATPADMHATIFHALGIMPDAVLYDQLGRPHRLCEGNKLPLF